MANYQVSSVPATVVPAGFVQIYAGTRASTDKDTGKKKVIDPANKSRSIVMKELVVTGAGRFEDFVRSQLYTVAESQLKEEWKDKGNNWTETPEELWTIDALLTYAARKSEVMKLNGELVKTHFGAFISIMDASKQDAIRDALISCASPLPNITLKQGEFLLAKISDWLSEQEAAQEEDADEFTNWIHRSVVRKIKDRVDNLRELDNAF